MCSHWLQPPLHVLINTPVLVLMSQWARFSLHRFKIQTIFCAALNVSKRFSSFNYDSAVVCVRCKMSFTFCCPAPNNFPLLGRWPNCIHTCGMFQALVKFKQVTIKVVHGYAAGPRAHFQFVAAIRFILSVGSRSLLKTFKSDPYLMFAPAQTRSH